MIFMQPYLCELAADSKQSQHRGQRHTTTSQTANSFPPCLRFGHGLGFSFSLSFPVLFWVIPNCLCHALHFLALVFVVWATCFTCILSTFLVYWSLCFTLFVSQLTTIFIPASSLCFSLCVFCLYLVNLNHLPLQQKLPSRLLAKRNL